MPGTVDLDDVFRMLDVCAPGHARRCGDHYWRVTFQDKVYPTLPTGAKSGKRKEIQIRKVLKMIQVLGIDADRATSELPALRTFRKARDPKTETRQT